MGELSRITRWSTPGAVALLTAAIVLMGTHAAIHTWALSDYRGLAMPAVTSALVALLIAASVPIGFVTYQIYFFSYAQPQGLFFSFVHMDVAVEVAHADTLKMVAEPREWIAKTSSGLCVRPFHWRIPLSGPFGATLWLYRRSSGDAPADPGPGKLPAAMPGDVALGTKNAHLDGGWRTRRREVRAVLRSYAERRESNWLVLESELYEHLRARGATERDFNDVDKLADIFHTLGAAKSALTLGWLGGGALILCQLATRHIIWTFGGLVATATVATLFVPVAVLYGALHGNRAHCMRRRIALIRSVIAAPATTDLDIKF